MNRRAYMAASGALRSDSFAELGRIGQGGRVARSEVPTADTYASLFEAHRRFLWGLCYRLTGSAADADDLVQETFVRAMERPPARTDTDWRPWLVRVAVNLGRDLLRRRRRRAYVGPWLPQPIETALEESPLSYEPSLHGISTESRYELVESLSFAFLLALEALTPTQRAVLLLRDVFDHGVRETAAALDMSEANVKTSLHRARRTMATYDRHRLAPTRTLQEETRQALGELLQGLMSQDPRAVRSVLSDDVCALTDGGGEFFAARRPILGPDRVARFYLGLGRKRSDDARFIPCVLNGLPGLLAEFTVRQPGEAPRVALLCAPDGNGRVRALYSVLATAKLSALRFDR